MKPKPRGRPVSRSYTIYSSKASQRHCTFVSVISPQLENWLYRASSSNENGRSRLSPTVWREYTNNNNTVIRHEQSFVVSIQDCLFPRICIKETRENQITCIFWITEEIKGNNDVLLLISFDDKSFVLISSSLICNTPYKGWTRVSCTNIALLRIMVIIKSQILLSSLRCPLWVRMGDRAYLYWSIRVMYNPHISSSTGRGSGMVTQAIEATAGTRKERKYVPTVISTITYRPVIEADPRELILEAKSSNSYLQNQCTRESCVSLITQNVTPSSKSSELGESLRTIQWYCMPNRLLLLAISSISRLLYSDSTLS